MPEDDGKLGSFLHKLNSRKNIALSRDYANDVSPEEYEQFVLGVGKRDALARRVSDMLSAYLSPNEESETPHQVLDIAAGTGVISRELAKNYQVTATDLSQPALSYLSQRNPEVQTITADMNRTLPFPNESFDGATTVWGNRFITDTDHFLEEVSRVLRPGGVFIWPIFPREGISWKLKAGIRQHTQIPVLARDALRNGFQTVIIDSQPFFENFRTHELPFTAAPMYLIAIK